MKRFDDKQTGILSSSDLKTAKGKLLYWLFFGILVIVCVFTLFPALWTILTAFKETQEIYGEFTLFPANMSPSNLWHRISDSWEQLQLGDSFINTIILSLGNCVSTVVVCGFAGYVLSKLKPRGSGVVFTLIVWTMMMPGQIRMVPNYIAMLNFPFASDYAPGISLLDSYWPMWLGAAASSYNVILFKNAFDALSQSYVEAGKLDGCGNFGIFFRIMFPLSMPIIIYVSIGALSGAWSDFFGPLLYLDKHAVTPLKIYRMNSDASIKMNTRFMGMVFSCIPPFIIFLIFQRQIMGGINIGGVKG